MSTPRSQKPAHVWRRRILVTIIVLATVVGALWTTAYVLLIPPMTDPELIAFVSELQAIADRPPSDDAPDAARALGPLLTAFVSFESEFSARAPLEQGELGRLVADGEETADSQRSWELVELLLVPVLDQIDTIPIDAVYPQPQLSYLGAIPLSSEMMRLSKWLRLRLAYLVTQEDHARAFTLARRALRLTVYRGTDTMLTSMIVSGLRDELIETLCQSAGSPEVTPAELRSAITDLHRTRSSLRDATRVLAREALGSLEALAELMDGHLAMYIRHQRAVHAHNWKRFFDIEHPDWEQYLSEAKQRDAEIATGTQTSEIDQIVNALWFSPVKILSNLHAGELRAEAATIAIAAELYRREHGVRPTLEDLASRVDRDPFHDLGDVSCTLTHPGEAPLVTLQSEHFEAAALLEPENPPTPGRQ